MAHFEFARVMVRLFAVVAFAYAAWLAASLVAQLLFLFPGMRVIGGPASDWGWSIAASVVPVGALVAVGAVMWFASDYIAGRVARSNGRSASPLVLDTRVLFGVGCSVIGLWLVVEAAMGASRALFFVVSDRDWQYVPEAQNPGGRFAVEGIRFILGLYLLLGARGIIAFVTRIRTAGVASRTTPPTIEDHPVDSD